MNVASVLPWDAPEAAVNVSLAGVEIRQCLPDCMGLEGRTKDATRSHILQGRDPRTIRVLIPDGRGPDQNIVPPEREQLFGGAGLFDCIDPEFDVIPLLDPGTDCQDELSSPDSSPMVIGPMVALLPSQVEEDVDLAHILAELGTLPAIVTPDS